MQEKERKEREQNWREELSVFIIFQWLRERGKKRGFGDVSEYLSERGKKGYGDWVKNMVPCYGIGMPPISIK